MEGFLEIYMLYNLLHLLFLGYCRYVLFKDQLRLKLGWVLVLVGILISATSAGWYFFLRTAMDYQVYRLFLTIFLYACSCLIIRVPVTKQTLSYLTIVTFSTVLETLSVCIAALFPAAAGKHLDTLLQAVVTPAVMLPLLPVMRGVNEQLSRVPKNRIWRYLCLCGACVVTLCLFTVPAGSDDYGMLLISRILMLGAMIGMLGSAVWITKSTCDAMETKAALALSQSQVEMQQTYYDNLITQMEEVRHIRHDLRHHRAALAAIIKNGDTQAAEEYIKSWDVLDEATPVTGNLVADSLLNYYCTRAKELGFTLQTEVSMPRLPGISDHDLCVLMGNLLENAIEAQVYLEPEQRFVSVRAKGDGSSFVLAIDNRFDGTEKKEKDRYLTRKEEKDHGIGLSSVRTVCKKYNGVLQLETKGDLFLSGVVIGL